MNRQGRSAHSLRSLAEVGLLVAADALVIILLFYCALLMRAHVLPRLYAGFPAELTFRTDLIGIWWVIAIWLFFHAYEGLYTKSASSWDEVRDLWKSAFFSSVGVFAVTSLGRLFDEISRTVVVLMWALSIVMFPLVRMLVKRLMRSAGLLQRKVLVLGAGETGRLISRALAREPNYGYRVVGYLDDDPAKVGTLINGVRVHGGVDKAARYIDRADISDIIIAMPGAGRERMQALLNSLQHKADRILFVPDMFGMAVMGTTLRHFFEEQAFALEFKNNLAQPLNYIVKRAFDYIVGSVIFIVLAVPIAIIALAIRAGSPGPAFFTQIRLGKNGRPFVCIKFRTMYADAEERLKEILRTCPASAEEYAKYWKLRDDPRVTAIGRLLRSTSLDELPQIINVLRGQMSLVGPRPYLVSERRHIRELSGIILGVRPGITGLWQVSGRSTTGSDYRIALDAWYVQNWNLWLDIVILIKTVVVVFRREGAF